MLFCALCGVFHEFQQQYYTVHFMFRQPSLEYIHYFVYAVRPIQSPHSQKGHAIDIWLSISNNALPHFLHFDTSKRFCQPLNGCYDFQSVLRLIQWNFTFILFFSYLIMIVYIQYVLIRHSTYGSKGCSNVQVVIRLLQKHMI